MSSACTPILMGVVSPVSEILLPFKNGQISLSGHGIVHGHQKIQLIGIGSKNFCKKGLMSSACTPVLVGVVSLVSEILLPFKNGQISLLGHGL